MNNQGSVAYQPSTAPVGQLNTSRSLLKFILLSIITLGIYSIVFYSSMSTNINIIASRYDGKKTMHYCLLFFLVGPITFGIAIIVWFHRISNRIGSELNRRNIDYKFGAADYWIFNILLAIVIVGPFIYLYKLCKAFNLVSQHYNTNG